MKRSQVRHDSGTQTLRQWQSEDQFKQPTYTKTTADLLYRGGNYTTCDSTNATSYSATDIAALGTFT